MKTKIIKSLLLQTLFFGLILSLNSCAKATQKKEKNSSDTTYPSDVIPFLDQWKIRLGNGITSGKLIDFQHKDFFYATEENSTKWIVYKTPNSGITSPNSSNTRTELGQKQEWTPEVGGKLTGTLKVMHVSTSGDARVAGSYSVVIGQIHGCEGHENEPLKIFYKKFPGHKKGSVFWNYEINTKGDNSKRWDFSSAVWGYDMSIIGTGKTTYPEEPEDGIELGEEFSYVVNVHKGIMYLTFTSKNHETKKFTKNLLESEFTKQTEIPQQVRKLYKSIGRDGTERANAYAGELQNFKQGAYNQTNGKNPELNMVTNTGSETYNGDLSQQYANGCYAEVWFKNATLGSSTDPNKH